MYAVSFVNSGWLAELIYLGIVGKQVMKKAVFLDDFGDVVNHFVLPLFIKINGQRTCTANGIIHPWHCHTPMELP